MQDSCWDGAAGEGRSKSGEEQEEGGRESRGGGAFSNSSGMASAEVMQGSAVPPSRKQGHLEAGKKRVLFRIGSFFSLSLSSVSISRGLVNLGVFHLV